MAANQGGPGIQADQPDPVGRMSELFAQVTPNPHRLKYLRYLCTESIAGQPVGCVLTLFLITFESSGRVSLYTRQPS